MITIFAIADGTDGKNHPYLWVLIAKNLDGLLQIVRTLIHCEFFFRKERGWTLLTIIHNFARFLQSIYVISAEGEKCGLAFTLPFLYRMQDAGGVIHHAKGIHRGTEHLLLEPLANAIGKARSHEEYLLAYPDLKIRLRNINNSSKFHNTTSSHFSNHSPLTTHL